MVQLINTRENIDCAGQWQVTTRQAQASSTVATIITQSYKVYTPESGHPYAALQKPNLQASEEAEMSQHHKHGVKAVEPDSQQGGWSGKPGS